MSDEHTTELSAPDGKSFSVVYEAEDADAIRRYGAKRIEYSSDWLHAYAPDGRDLMIPTARVVRVDLGAAS